MEEKNTKVQSFENQSQGCIDLTNAEVMTEKADEVWTRVKKSSVTVEELDKLVPMSNEFLKGLVGIITKEIESGETQHAEYADLVRANQAIILKMLENGSLSSQERIEIIRNLSELSSKIAEIQDKSDKRHAENKRLGIVCGAAVMALTVIAGIVVINRKDN